MPKPRRQAMSAEEKKAKQSARDRAYALANPEKIRLRHAAHYQANKVAIDARKEAWRKKNWTHVQAYARQYRIKNRTQILVKKRQWANAHRQSLNVKRRNYRARYPERLQALQRRYAAKDPQGYKEIRRLATAKRRARKRLLPSTQTRKDWQRALEYWGYTCAVCGMRTGLFHRIVPDHWIPLANPLSPGDVPTNVVPLCHTTNVSYPSCNLSKSDTDAETWLLSQYSRAQTRCILKAIETYFAIMREDKNQSSAAAD